MRYCVCERYSQQVNVDMKDVVNGLMWMRKVLSMS